MDRETTGNCCWASGSEGPRPLLGKPGPGQCETQSWCVLGSRPLAVTGAGGAWGGVMHGKDGFADLALNPGLLG